MKQMIMIAVLMCTPAIAETHAYTMYFNQNVIAGYPNGIFKECVQVFVKSNDTHIHSFKVSISYIDSDGVPQVRTQTIDRWTGEFENSAVATFYISGITGLKPATITPLAIARDTVISQ